MRLIAGPDYLTVYVLVTVAVHPDAIDERPAFDQRRGRSELDRWRILRRRPRLGLVLSRIPWSTRRRSRRRKESNGAGNGGEDEDQENISHHKSSYFSLRSGETFRF